MLISKDRKISSYIFIFIILCLFSYCVFLQFISPTFYEGDSYYHLTISRLIKAYGPFYKFHWVKFSTYQNNFADKDFFFHLLTVPFLFLTQDVVMGGKYAIIFFNLLFLLVFAFILKKYLPYYLASIFLVLPFLSSTFTTYILYLRSYTLANILTILGIYYLLKKRVLGVFIISLLYPLTHTSFSTIIFFAFICEAMRYIVEKDFYFRNIYIAIIGTMLGCLIHPNFPYNLLYTHLCYLVVEYVRKGFDLGFGLELFSYPITRIFTENYALFFSMNMLLWMAFFSRAKINLATAVWGACANFYLILSFQSYRHWYVTNILFFIFFASYIKDWFASKLNNKLPLKANVFVAVYLITMIIFFPASFRILKSNIKTGSELGIHYKKVALWMKENIPNGETIYHNYWSDSAYFICFNPSNNYLVVLDPLYMYYRYPETFLLYRDLSRGLINKPHEALKEVFKVKYGYTRKDNLFYVQIKDNPAQFIIIYDDNLGVVFKLLNN